MRRDKSRKGAQPNSAQLSPCYDAVALTKARHVSNSGYDLDCGTANNPTSSEDSVFILARGSRPSQGNRSACLAMTNSSSWANIYTIIHSTTSQNILWRRPLLVAKYTAMPVYPQAFLHARGFSLTDACTMSPFLSHSSRGSRSLGPLPIILLIAGIFE